MDAALLARRLFHKQEFLVGPPCILILHMLNYSSILAFMFYIYLSISFFKVAGSTWRSMKQAVVARSSVEAEYRAMALGVCELLWTQYLLTDLGLATNAPMKLFCDNKAAISIAHDPVQHDRTKHIEIDRHFIKEKPSKGLICIPYVKSSDQFDSPYCLQVRHEEYLCSNLRGSVKVVNSWLLKSSIAGY